MDPNLFKYLPKLLHRLLENYAMKESISTDPKQIWYCEKYSWIHLILISSLKEYEVSAIFEIVYALQQKVYVFFLPSSNTILERLQKVFPQMTDEQIQMAHKNLYNYTNVQYWMYGLSDYFESFLPGTWSVLLEKFPYQSLESFQILDLSALQFA